MSAAKTIAAFDLDGTLTRRDTFIAFIRYVRGDLRFAWGMGLLSPALIAYKLGLIRNDRAKEIVMRWFFRGMAASRLDELGDNFCREKMPGLMRKKGLQRLNWHQKQGHACYLVTASLTFWTRPWAVSQQMTLVASHPQIIDGYFTGKLEGANNYGPEKVRRLKEVFGDQQIEKKYAYGDSRGDRELLAWADEGFYRPFRD